jgi:hypothetical protein
MAENLADILLERQRYRRKYFENYRFYVKKIAKLAEEMLGSVRVLVFGSVIENAYHPGSDIDVLMISEDLPSELEERAKIRTKIKAGIDPFSPFQIHLATPKEFEDWLKNFLKANYLEI